MSIDRSADVPGREPTRRFTNLFTGIVVALALMLPSVVGQVSGHDTGTTSHLWDHFKGLREVGTINADSNPLHWTKLKGVPAGLADGVDDGVTVAGFGLNKIWGAFAVDPNEVQKRVTTACPSGHAIKSISKDGTAVCAPVSQALAKTIADTGIICNAWCSEGSLTLTPGTWAITAKIVIYQDDYDEDRLIFECRLVAGGIYDEAKFVSHDDSPAGVATASTQVLATVVQGGDLTAKLYCEDRDRGDAVGRDLSIMAIRVGG